jgi:hypothetical protein
MSEEQATTTKEVTPRAGKTRTAGIVEGVPSRHIESSGVLDLRGVPAEKVAQIESIQHAGVILLDEQNRDALDQVSIQSAGAVVVAGPDVRVLVEPWLEFSRSTVEGMPAGQKLMLVGIVLFKPDVPPALVAEKFDTLRVVGVLLACAGVRGALLGKMDITGVSVTLPDDVGPIVKSIGHTLVTPGYLSHLPDHLTYVNIGATEFAAEVSEELVARKIESYHNVGATIAPAPLLDLLKARCPTNLGKFSEPGAEEEGGDEAEAEGAE